MLTLENLLFRYRDSAGPHSYRFDLSVEPGMIAGLTGRSGAGKSTCLDLIAGFLRPDGGRVLVDGGDISGLPPEQRPLTILFQRNNLFEHLTATDNVALGINPGLRLTDTERQEVERALADVGLGALQFQQASKLSGGEQQRVALARSLVRRKPVLLLDEPFSALDTETKQEMLSLVREIVSTRRLAALMVTHDVEDCRRVADRHFVIENDQVKRLPLDG